jgi:hypothetical protein
MTARAVSGTVAVTRKRSRGRHHRPDVVEQAGGSSSRRHIIDLRVRRSRVSAMMSSYGREQAGLWWQ